MINSFVDIIDDRMKEEKVGSVAWLKEENVFV